MVELVLRLDELGQEEVAVRVAEDLALLVEDGHQVIVILDTCFAHGQGRDQQLTLAAHDALGVLAAWHGARVLAGEDVPVEVRQLVHGGLLGGQAHHDELDLGHGVEHCHHELLKNGVRMRLINHKELHPKGVARAVHDAALRTLVDVRQPGLGEGPLGGVTQRAEAEQLVLILEVIRHDAEVALEQIDAERTIALAVLGGASALRDEGRDGAVVLTLAAPDADAARHGEMAVVGYG
mmetsp:Transcript_4702/g.10134  ORF Transcript_4702/g.10134 Transcript_4702/m.10134 type:complete len:237 (+) Transcript_4702:892-1602(+)